VLVRQEESKRKARGQQSSSAEMKKVGSELASSTISLKFSFTLTIIVSLWFAVNWNKMLDNCQS